MNGVLWVTGIAAALLLAWWASLAFWPWKDCPRCTAGKVYAPGNSTAFRDCPRCGGTRRVRRPGAGKER